ncbi:MAG: DUF4127 family protein [Clostridia bacterium]|nr:DUF4127 family protein [Clostridia bacterium]
MKVLFLPVDSRPCNRLFPKQLLEWCGVECILPPEEVQDHFTQPSDWQGIQAFLTEHAAEADARAISLDQLCFGSLLGSRELDMTEAQALERLEWFERLRRNTRKSRYTRSTPSCAPRSPRCGSPICTSTSP